MLFYDRHDAGKQLAQRLVHFQSEKPYVLALPRGGVVVGYEVAKALNAPLDVLVVRKLGAPNQPELGIGAIAPNGVRVLNQEMIRWLGITDWQLEAIVSREVQEMERRLKRYRGDRPLPDLQGRTVILVDDGLATGNTAKAAIRAIYQMHPNKVVLAIPVCAPDTAAVLQREVGTVICLASPTNFMSVGSWYRMFEQTTDEEVVQLLTKAQQAVNV